MIRRNGNYPNKGKVNETIPDSVETLLFIITNHDILLTTTIFAIAFNGVGILSLSVSLFHFDIRSVP